MLRRAAAPGVTHGGMGLRRREIGTGAALATEIQRRWAPADSAGWGSGPALHYAGQVAASGPGMPSVQASPAGSAPRAQVVGQAASPAAQATASMGESLQRQHLGARVSEGTTRTARTDAAPMPVVQRKAVAAPTVQSQAASSPAVPAAPVPASQPAASGAGAAPASSPVTGAVLMPAIVRRSAGSPAAPPVPAMPLRLAPDSLSREAGEGRGGGAPVTAAAPVARATPAAPASSSSTMMPAIVRRSPASPRPLTPNPSPIAHPSPGRGEPERTALPVASPLSRVVGGNARPEAGVGQGVRGSGSVQRTPAPAPPPAPAPSLTASAAGLAMPLARSSAAPAASGSAPASNSGGGVIQRQAIGGGSGESSSSSPETVFPPAEGSSSAAGPDIDEVVDRVMRRLTRTLAVENERHGGRRWP